MSGWNVKWQPVMLVTKNRLECACGSLAIFVVLDEDLIEHDPTGEKIIDYTAWCQQCFAKAQQEDESE